MNSINHCSSRHSPFKRGKLFFSRYLAAVGKFSYAGLAYTLEDIPLVVSIDWSPRYFFGNTYGYYSRLGWGYGAVTMRYVLK